MSDPRKWRKFAKNYVVHFNKTKAALAAGAPAKSAHQQGYTWFKMPQVQAMIAEELEAVHMSADEAIKLLSDIARGDVGKFYDDYGELQLTPEISKLIKRIKKKKIKYNGKYSDREIETEEIELYSALDALEKILRVYGKFKDNLKIETDDYTDEERIARLTALLDAARARRDGQDTE